MCGSDKSCGCGCEAKVSRAPARARDDAKRGKRSERDVVLVDREGRPFDRPRRSDFRTEAEYLDAYDDHRRRILDAMSNRGMELSLERERDRGHRLTRAERRRLAPSQFALPERRALPIHDASHTRNAAARLEQMRNRGSVTPTEYRQAKERILRADVRFGITPRAHERDVSEPYFDTFTVSAEYPAGRQLQHVERHDSALRQAARKNEDGSGTAVFGDYIHDIDWSAPSMASAEAMAARLRRVRIPGLHVAVRPPLLNERDVNTRARRDPSSPMIEGALYYLEWDGHGEGDEGTYVYQGIYPQTGAAMFRRVSRSPKQRVTIYLFPHEVRYLELLQRPRGASGVPAPPSSETRSRKAPELRAGRVLMRRAWQQLPHVWDEGIVGPAVAQEAQFQGFRRIDGEMFGVWSNRGMLYAQPRRP